MKTFSEIAESTGTDRFSRFDNGSLRPIAVAHDTLFGPGKGGWLKACRAWVHEGQTDDPRQVYTCLGRIIQGLDPFPEGVARLHLLATRMAWCAKKLLQIEEPLPRKQRPSLQQTLLDCAWRALQPERAKDPASRATVRDLGKRLAADSPTSLVREALTMAAGQAHLITPEQAPDTWHLHRVGWLCDLADYLLSDPSQAHRRCGREVRSSFVLVPQTEEGKAYVAEFLFETVPGAGTGEVFVAPEQGFLMFGKGFDTVFSETADVAAGLLKKDRKALADIRLKIHTVDHRTGQRDWHGIHQKPIEGSSATGAAVRGLHAAWSSPARVCDLAVVCLCAANRGARVSPVSDLEKKLKAVVASGLFDTIVIDAGKDSLTQIEGKVPDYQIEPVDTAEALIGIRSALVKEVVKYLEDLKRQCAQLPRYYPERFRKEGFDQEGGFDQVRQMVQVVTDRSSLDKYLAQQREGLDLEAVAYGPSRGLPDEEEGWQEQPKKVKIIPWDHRAGRQFRRAIILGDPGFGKTWLLRYEARRLAQEGIERLSVHQSHNLDQIAFPIYLRLSDLAQSRGALDKALVKQVVGKRSRRFESLVRERLESDRCTILLDAWDEVPNREELQPRIEKFAKDFSKPQILLTSRIVGYEQTLPPISKAKEVELLALDQRQVRSFVEVWFGDRTRASQFEAKLRNSIQVRGLARIPLMLGMLCRVCPDGDFPARRADLYESCLRGLLQHWHVWDQKVSRGKGPKVNRSDAYVDALMEILGEISLRLLDKGEEQYTEPRLRQILEPWLKSKRRCSTEFQKKKVSSSDLIERFRDDGILVKSRSDDASPLIFLHRTFHEYLAARALAKESDCIERVLARMYGPGWSQVLVLFAGMLEAKQARAYLAAVLDKNGEDLLCRPFLLALEVAGEMPREGTNPKVFALLAEETVRNSLGKREELSIRVRSRLAFLPEAVKSLKVALNDNDVVIRQSAAEALREMSSESAAAELKTVLEGEHKDMGVRRAAAWALRWVGSESAVEVLITTLKDAEAEVRGIAALSLGEIGSASAIEPLKALLKDEDNGVRRLAAIALGEIRSDLVVEALNKILRDGEAEVRRLAVIAFGIIGGEPAVAALETALSDKAAEVREEAAEALGQIGTESALERLEVVLADDETTVRGKAVEALGQIGGESAVEKLKTALKDNDVEIRFRAAEALRKIGSESAVEELRTALKDEDGWVRERAALALGQIGSESGVKELTAALRDSDWSVCEQAATALSRIGGESAEAALKAALKDKDAAVRWLASQALGETGAKSAVKELIAALKDQEPAIRSEAAKALGRIGSESAVGGLRTALKDQEKCVRWEAAQALGKIGGESALEALAIAFTEAVDTKDATLVVRVLSALIESDPELAEEVVKPDLMNEDERVRGVAVECLGHVGTESSVEALTVVLRKDKSERVRRYAAEALSMIASESALEALMGALADKAEDVRRQAIETLWRVPPSRPVRPNPAFREFTQLQTKLHAVRSLLES